MSETTAVPAATRPSQRIVLVAVLLAGLLAVGGTARAGDFFAAVRDHPNVRAAADAYRAADARLQGVHAPLAVNGTFGVVRLQTDPFRLPDDFEMPEFTIDFGDDVDTDIEIEPITREELEEFLAELLATPDLTAQLTLEATLRPFPHGDIADLAERLAVERERALLGYAEALAALEAQALEAAATAELAADGVLLAEAARDLAALAFDATRIRATRGGAGDGELRDAEMTLLDAEANLASARLDLELALLSLRSLVGNAPPPARVDLPRLRAEPLETRRALLDVRLAEIGLRNATRGTLPVGQASYSRSSEDGRNSVAVSVESRTLQPNLRYSHAPGGGLGGATRGTFQVGVSVTLSGDALAEIDAASRQLDAARAIHAAAAERADLAARGRRNALEVATRSLDIAERGLENARRRAADTDRRVELGLATDLEARQAHLAARQAELGVRSARLELQRRTLDDYRASGTPPSSVLAPEEHP